MSDREKEIQEQIAALESEKHSFELKRLRENTLPAMRNRIGETFVYRRNCYSSGEYFDSFRKLVGICDGEYNLTLLLEVVQIDSEGRPELSLEFDWVGFSGMGMFDGNHGWKPCSKKEYAKNRAKALRQLEYPEEAMRKIRKKN